MIYDEEDDEGITEQERNDWDSQSDRDVCDEQADDEAPHP
jgi:hypothetical protein